MSYVGFQFEEDGHPAVAVINSALKQQADRFEYDHAVFITVIPDAVNEYGHPEEIEQEYLVAVENKLVAFLERSTKSIYVGHTTLYKKIEIILYTKTPVIVQSFLEQNLRKINREHAFEIEQDENWDQVSGFFEQL